MDESFFKLKIFHLTYTHLLTFGSRIINKSEIFRESGAIKITKYIYVIWWLWVSQCKILKPLIVTDTYRAYV